MAAYLVGVALCGLRLLASLIAVSRLRRRTHAVTDSNWLEQLAVWRTRCGLRRAVELRHGGDVTVPIVIGFRRPAIIVPTDLLESAGGERRDAILAHELAHIVRGDLGWQLLERLVGAALWFHPLAWFAGRRIGLVRERICDGFAVHHLGRRTVYVETLLEMATRLTSRRGLSLGLAVLRSSQLGARLASVQNARSMERCQVRPAARWAVLALTAAAALWAGRAAVGVEPVPQVAGLPSDAQALLAGYEQKSAQLQAEVDRQVSAERDALIKSLQALQDEYTKQARLDEAVAIRDQLRLIKSPKMAATGLPIIPPAAMGMGMPGRSRTIRVPRGMPGVYPGGMGAPGNPWATPGGRPAMSRYPVPPTRRRHGGTGVQPGPAVTPLSMTPFRKSIGKVLLVEVTGSQSGTVWGDSEVCTDDSSLAAAAVQFGVLRPGERGMIKVTVCPGKKNYAGFSGHGVSSSSWDNNNGGYASLKIEAAPDGAYQACHPISGAVAGEDIGTTDLTVEDNKTITLANFVGYTFVFQSTGQVNSILWGTDQYTHDSSLGAAAVHAGALQAGQSGYVFMLVKPGIPFYRGSTRNGVTSSDWNNSGNNYVTLTFQSPSAAAQEAEDRPATADYLPSAVIQLRAASEASSELFRRSVGHAICFNVTGSSEGVIWGSNPYTDDSSLAAAAVHAGILQPGEQGIIEIDVEPALDTYPGSSQHGVTSQTWNSGGGYVALRLSRVNLRGVIPLEVWPNRPGGAKPSASRRVLPDPETMTDYVQSLGQSFMFRVTGSTGGSIWGTDVYTNDSALATAAVHAGVLRAGETGIVKVTMLPALPQYHGSTNNGITSQPWENDGSYVSYKVERADGLRTRGRVLRGDVEGRSSGLTEYEVDGSGAAPSTAPRNGSSDANRFAVPGLPAPATETAPSGAPLGYNTWADHVAEPKAPPGAPRAGGRKKPRASA